MLIFTILHVIDQSSVPGKILHVNIHNSACYSSVISSMKILHVNIHNSELIFTILHVIDQSSVPGKFCMLIMHESP